MGGLRCGLQKVQHSVYKQKDLFKGVSCSCGSTHFRYEQEVTLAGFPFYGYTCMACGELMFVDKEAMIDSPYLQTIRNESVLEHNCNIILDKVV